MTRWSILIASLARRSATLEQVLADLAPQLTDEVEVVVYRNHGELPLGHIRQALVEDARGTYVSFVDDDDRIPDYHVHTVLPLLDGVDYVGWRMQAYISGEKLKPTYHTLDVDSWWESPDAYWRDISHLNPVRRHLALQCDFRATAPPEDVSWADQMRGLVLTQNMCRTDVSMYEYTASSDSTWRPGHEPAWDGSDRLPPGAPNPFNHFQMRWHPSST